MAYVHLTEDKKLLMYYILDRLEKELEYVRIPKQRRRKVYEKNVRSITFGQVVCPIGKDVNDSVFNERLPTIWMLIKNLGKLIASDISWTSVQLNHNLVCKKHTDGNNAGASVIVSFGNYTGNDLVVEGKKFDINHRPVLFDGRKEHWNTPQLGGNKYSLVYFRI